MQAVLLDMMAVFLEQRDGDKEAPNGSDEVEEQKNVGETRPCSCIGFSVMWCRMSKEGIVVRRTIDQRCEKRKRERKKKEQPISRRKKQVKRREV